MGFFFVLGLGLGLGFCLGLGLGLGFCLGLGLGFFWGLGKRKGPTRRSARLTCHMFFRTILNPIPTT